MPLFKKCLRSKLLDHGFTDMEIVVDPNHPDHFEPVMKLSCIYLMTRSQHQAERQLHWLVDLAISESGRCGPVGDAETGEAE